MTYGDEPEPPFPARVDADTGIVDQTKVPDRLNGEFRVPTDPPKITSP